MRASRTASVQHVRRTTYRRLGASRVRGCCEESPAVTPGASSSRRVRAQGPSAGDRSSARQDAAAGARWVAHTRGGSPDLAQHCGTSHRAVRGESAEQVGRAMATDSYSNGEPAWIRAARKHTPGWNPLILATQPTRHPHAPTLPRNSPPKPSGTVYIETTFARLGERAISSNSQEQAQSQTKNGRQKNIPQMKKQTKNTRRKTLMKQR